MSKNYNSSSTQRDLKDIIRLINTAHTCLCNAIKLAEKYPDRFTIQRDFQDVVLTNINKIILSRKV